MVVAAALLATVPPQSEQLNELLKDNYEAALVAIHRPADLDALDEGALP